VTDMPSAQTPEDLPDQATALSMSGLEYMQKILSGELCGTPMSQTMGYHLHTVEAGRVVFQGLPQFAHANQMGGVHGGWYGAILDSCMACAVMSNLKKGSTYTTLEYKINITRAIPLGMLVNATGTALHSGRSTAVANGEVRGAEDGKLYATGTTTCLVMTPR